MDELPPAFVAALETAAQMAAGSPQILVMAPRRLEEAQQIIEAVHENQTVLVQTSDAEDGVAQRLIDFVCGGMAAIDGQVHRINAETFLFSPGHVRVEEL